MAFIGRPLGFYTGSLCAFKFTISPVHVCTKDQLGYSKALGPYCHHCARVSGMLTSSSTMRVAVKRAWPMSRSSDPKLKKESIGYEHRSTRKTVPFHSAILIIHSEKNVLPNFDNHPPTISIVYFVQWDEFLFESNLKWISLFGIISTDHKKIIILNIYSNF